MSSKGTTPAPSAVRAPAGRPAIGAVLDTIYGRQTVMDIIGTAPAEADRATVYLRPEGGGLEWSVPLSSYAAILTAPANGQW